MMMRQYIRTDQTNSRESSNPSYHNYTPRSYSTGSGYGQILQQTLSQFLKYKTVM